MKKKASFITTIRAWYDCSKTVDKDESLLFVVNKTRHTNAIARLAPVKRPPMELADELSQGAHKDDPAKDKHGDNKVDRQCRGRCDHVGREASERGLKEEYSPKLKRVFIHNLFRQKP